MATSPRSASAWRTALDASLLSAVLLVQNIGDNLRSGGAIVTVTDKTGAKIGSSSHVSTKPGRPSSARRAPPTTSEAARIRSA